MRILKRLVGVLAIFLGGVGLVACLAGFIGIWVVRARTDTAVSKITERVDVALSTLEGRARQANQRIDNTRDCAVRLNERVQQRVAELRGVPTEDAPDIDEIERQLYARIELGRDSIGFVQSGVDMVKQFLEMLNSTSLFREKDSKTHADVVAAVRAGHKEIQEALKLADEAKTHLENIRVHRNLDESARQIQSLSSRIGDLLENVKRYGEGLEAAILQLKADAANVGARIRRQLLVIAVIATLALIWLAASQVSLAIHGWRLLRSQSQSLDGAVAH